MQSCWTGVLLSSLIIVPALLAHWHERLHEGLVVMPVCPQPIPWQQSSKHS